MLDKRINPLLLQHSLKRRGIMRFFLPHAVSEAGIPKLIAAPVLISLLLSGCGGIAGIKDSLAIRNRYIRQPTPLFEEMAVSSKNESLVVRINYVIVPNGPGSWVRDAKWHEYVITMTNTSPHPVTIQNVRILNKWGLYVPGGMDPMKLEAQSELLMQYEMERQMLLVSAAAFGGANLITKIGGAAGALVLTPAALLGAPYYLMNKEYEKARDRENIKKEFESRNMVVGQKFAPYATISGSVFFPITMEPKALDVEASYQGSGKSKNLEISLTPMNKPQFATAQAKNTVIPPEESAINPKNPKNPKKAQ